jgi:predicted ribosomally synthesized peptide with SipW-like signal peptide
MTDDTIELTRRKVLASVGAVGAAGAIGGYGTSALFSDEEMFEDNTITAGTLDLKIDWEEHYSYPQIYDLGDPEEGRDVTRMDPAEDPSRTAANYVALPDPENPVVWVHEDDFEDYFADTVIEAFPDAEDDPIEANFDTEQPCRVLADVPMNLGAYTDEMDDPGRTRNADTYDDNDDEVRPLIHLEDVKPGDYGELTISTHLCHNDGYLWMQMPGGLAESENGIVEPEESVDDTQDEGELAENVQTALWYDDDCSNTINGAPEPLVAMALVDTSNSIDGSDMQTIAAASDEFVETLNQRAATEVYAGVMTFGDADPNPGGSGPNIVLQNDVELLEPGSAYLDSSGNGQFDPGNNLLPSEGSGNTPLAPALDLAREVLNDRAQTLVTDPNNNITSEPRKTILVLSDGQPTTPLSGERYSLVDASGATITANSGNGVDIGPGDQFVSDIFDGLANNDANSNQNDEAALVARDIDTGNRDDVDQYADADAISGANDVSLRTVGLGTQNISDLNDFLTRIASDDGFFYNASLQGTDLVDVVDSIVNGLNVTGPAEKVICRGTLAELATQLDPDQEGPMPLDGMPMGDEFDEKTDPGDDPARDCFDASATQCFGFAWWVPRDVGNVIQSDSVAFDLGFYTEQCRSSDGSLSGG